MLLLSWCELHYWACLLVAQQVLGAAALSTCTGLRPSFLADSECGRGLWTMSVLCFLGDSPVDHDLPSASLCFPYLVAPSCCFPPLSMSSSLVWSHQFHAVVSAGPLSSVFWCDLLGFLRGFCVFSDTLFPAG